MTLVDGLRVDVREIYRPWYPAVLRAYVAVLDEGKEPSYANIAVKLGISRQAVWQMFIRHPDLLPWINRQVSAHTSHYIGGVVRRVAMLAMKGSPQHAEMFLRHHAGFYSRDSGDLAPNGGQTNINNGFVINNMVPRPEALPPVPAPPLALPAAIPVVATR